MEYQEQKDGTIKYKGITIQKTPSETYPTLVTFIKTIKKGNEILGKKFLTLGQGVKYIDKWELELWERKTQVRLGKQEGVRAKKELLKLNGLQLIKSGGD